MEKGNATCAVKDTKGEKLTYQIPANQQQLAQYANNFFRGTVQPVKRFQSSPPLYQKSIIVGQEGRLFSKLRAWVHKPTLNFPSAGYFVSLKNSNGYCYSKITVDDIKMLLSFFGNLIQEIERLQPEILSQVEQINKTLQYHQQIQAMQQLQANNQINGDGYESDSEFMPEGLID